MSTPIGLNNQLIQSLRSGKAEPVARMVGFGVRPDTLIDWVERLSERSVTEQETVWHWSHQSRQVDGAMAWWDLVERRLEKTPAADRWKVLVPLVHDACRAAMASGHHEPLVSTWSAAQLWIPKSPGLDRGQFVGRCAQALVEAPREEPACAAVRALFEAGLFSAKDWALEASSRFPLQPLAALARQRRVASVLTLLDAGVPAQTLEGSFLGWAWSVWNEERNLQAVQVDPKESVIPLVVALFERGLDWDVPVPGSSPSETVAHQAQRWANTPPHRSHWDPLRRQVEHRMLRTATQTSKPPTKSPARL